MKPFYSVLLLITFLVSSEELTVLASSISFLIAGLSSSKLTVLIVIIFYTAGLFAW